MLTENADVTSTDVVFLIDTLCVQKYPPHDSIASLRVPKRVRTRPTRRPYTSLGVPHGVPHGVPWRPSASPGVPRRPSASRLLPAGCSLRVHARFETPQNATWRPGRGCTLPLGVPRRPSQLHWHVSFVVTSSRVSRDASFTGNRWDS